MGLFQLDYPQLGPGATIDVSDQGVSGSGANIQTFVKIPRTHTISVPNLSSSSTSFIAFVSDQTYQIYDVSVSFGTASSSGTLSVEVAPSGTAVGSGTAVLSSTISLSGTHNTPVYGTLVTNIDSLQIVKGSMVNVLLAGTLTNLADCCVTIQLIRK